MFDAASGIGIPGSSNHCFSSNNGVLPSIGVMSTNAAVTIRSRIDTPLLSTSKKVMGQSANAPVMRSRSIQVAGLSVDHSSRKVLRRRGGPTTHRTKFVGERERCTGPPTTATSNREPSRSRGGGGSGNGSGGKHDIHWLVSRGRLVQRRRGGKTRCLVLRHRFRKGAIVPARCGGLRFRSWWWWSFSCCCTATLCRPFHFRNRQPVTLQHSERHRLAVPHRRRCS